MKYLLLICVVAVGVAAPPAPAPDWGHDLPFNDAGNFVSGGEEYDLIEVLLNEDGTPRGVYHVLDMQGEPWTIYNETQWMHPPQGGKDGGGLCLGGCARHEFVSGLGEHRFYCESRSEECTIEVRLPNSKDPPGPTPPDEYAYDCPSHDDDQVLVATITESDWRLKIRGSTKLPSAAHLR